MTTRSFGSWESPITSEFITANQIKLVEIGINAAKDEVFWVEGRPTEGNKVVYSIPCVVNSKLGGRQVVVGCSDGIGVDLTPEGGNTRSRVHEYGGALMMFTKHDGQ